MLQSVFNEIVRAVDYEKQDKLHQRNPNARIISVTAVF